MILGSVQVCKLGTVLVLSGDKWSVSIVKDKYCIDVIYLALFNKIVYRVFFQFIFAKLAELTQ